MSSTTRCQKEGLLPVPRTTIELKQKVEYLSILDESGVVDQALEPKLSNDELLGMYRSMVLTRLLDERMLAMQRQGRIGTYAPVRGQEAVQIGAVAGMRLTDWIVQAFREPGCCLHRGWPVVKILQYWGGYEEGNVIPDGICDVPMCVPIATQYPHATGIAWGIKMKGKDDVVVAFVGDGGTSEGDFHEALTFAGVFQVPGIFIIVNNHWAISHPRSRQTASETLAQKALSYGFDGIQVDGNDVLAVYAATTEAIAKARKGGGPTLIEAVTYRMGVHTTADDPRKYRDEAEVKEWEQRDPVTRFTDYLVAKGVLDSTKIESIETDVKEQIKAGVVEYEASQDVDPLECFDFLYHDMPVELAAQRQEFAEALQREGGVTGH